MHSENQDSDAYSPSMRRQMLRFLQKRKFRLVTRWRSTLKETIGFQLPIHRDFPFGLIFRSFDELVYLLKQDKTEPDHAPRPSFLDQVELTHPPTADQYMELFLTGREVLLDFIHNDPSFRARFSPADIQHFGLAVERAVKCLIQREMTEYSRKFQDFSSS